MTANVQRVAGAIRRVMPPPGTPPNIDKLARAAFQEAMQIALETVAVWQKEFSVTREHGSYAGAAVIKRSLEKAMSSAFAAEQDDGRTA